MGRRKTEARIERMRGAPIALPKLPDDPVEALIVRARKIRDRGDIRRTLVLLRQACALDEWRARSFTILGALLAQEGMFDEAQRALNHARWLRARAGEKARAAVTERLANLLVRVAA